MTVADLALSLLAVVAIVQLYVVLRDRQAVDAEPDTDLVVPIDSDELNQLRIKARAFDRFAGELRLGFPPASIDRLNSFSRLYAAFCDAAVDLKSAREAAEREARS